MMFHDDQNDFQEMGSPHMDPSQMIASEMDSPLMMECEINTSDIEKSELDVFLDSILSFENDENTCQNTRFIQDEDDDISSSPSSIQKRDFYTFDKKLGVSIFIYPPYGEDQNEYAAFIADDGRTVVSIDGYAFENNFEWTQFIVNQYHFSHFKNAQEKQEFQSEFKIKNFSEQPQQHGHSRTFTPFEETSFESIFQNL